ncbi:MAG: hypothetical protein LUI13_12550 [Lachnospiraceae bacterium]|nr:hypothetical protein [Lachnospiraceae bacterium]
MIIHSKFKDYEVKIEQNLDFLEVLSQEENTEFVIDQKVYDLYQEHFQAIPANRLILIEATEQNKVIQTALDICEKMTEIPAKRNAQLVSVGGGIIQDITGFVANILYRGIRWIFVPTTLLASCDSCIGGKTSLNYKKYKNLLGTFYPPDQLHICSAFFKTLTERDYKSGLCEVVKFNIMAGEDRLAQITEDMDGLLVRESGCVNRYVESSLLFKKSFIEVDEFDRGERIKLNFAHTFGHAIEVVTNYEIPHGTAVAIGMIMADSISLKRQLLSAELVTGSENVLLKVIDINPELLDVPQEQVLDAMRKDKKQTSQSLTAVLLTENGLELIHDMETEEVAYAFDYFRSLYADYCSVSR